MRMANTSTGISRCCLVLTTQAVTYAWTFNIQAHFDIAEMVLPLIAMDKINLIER